MTQVIATDARALASVARSQLYRVAIVRVQSCIELLAIRTRARTGISSSDSGERMPPSAMCGAPRR
jgi:hypothetical protein